MSVVKLKGRPDYNVTKGGYPVTEGHCDVDVTAVTRHPPQVARNQPIHDMSLARAAALATRAKSSPSLSSQTRRASTAAHDEHHDAHAVDHHHDATQYPEEGPVHVSLYRSATPVKSLCIF